MNADSVPLESEWQPALTRRKRSVRNNPLEAGPDHPAQEGAMQPATMATEVREILELETVKESVQSCSQVTSDRASRHPLAVTAQQAAHITVIEEVDRESSTSAHPRADREPGVSLETLKPTCSGSEYQPASLREGSGQKNGVYFAAVPSCQLKENSSCSAKRDGIASSSPQLSAELQPLRRSLSTDIICAPTAPHQVALSVPISHGSCSNDQSPCKRQIRRMQQQTLDLKEKQARGHRQHELAADQQQQHQHEQARVQLPRRRRRRHTETNHAGVLPKEDASAHVQLRPAQSLTATAGPPLSPDVAAASGVPAAGQDSPKTSHSFHQQSFRNYLDAELEPGPSYPAADTIWGQTERDRVYNALVYVPYQLERLLWFGTFICCDSFLAVFTVLPLRVLFACCTLGRAAVHHSKTVVCQQKCQPALDHRASKRQFNNVGTVLRQLPQQALSSGRNRRRQKQRGASFVDDELAAASQQLQNGSHEEAAAALEHGEVPSAATVAPVDMAARCSLSMEVQRRTLGGDQLFDIICVIIFSAAVAALWCVDAGAMYFWMKDLTQEFLKLSIIYSSLEILDKILCSFGVDTLHALSSTCTLFTTGDRQRGRAWHLAADSAVSAMLVAAHAVILMCQGMAFSVAMNSKRTNTMVALLIASNFAEVKGVVLKRFDPRRLLILSYQDIVERFHLSTALAFVVVEEMASTGRWAPNPRLLHNCAIFFGFEIVIDVTKHAVVGKFNEVRPGMYREFMRDVAGEAASAQSHSSHRIIAFEPLAPAALALRISTTLATIAVGTAEEASWLRLLGTIAAAATLWGVALAAKLLLGFALKRLAAAYVVHFDKTASKTRNAAKTRAVG